MIFMPLPVLIIVTFTRGIIPIFCLKNDEMSKKYKKNSKTKYAK